MGEASDSCLIVAELELTDAFVVIGGAVGFSNQWLRSNPRRYYTWTASSAPSPTEVI